MRVVALALAALLLASCSPPSQADPRYKLVRICSEHDYMFIGPTGRFYLTNVRHIYTYPDGSFARQLYVEQLPEGTTPDSLCGSK